MDGQVPDRRVFNEVAVFSAVAVDSVHLQAQQLPLEGTGQIDLRHECQSQDLKFLQALTAVQVLLGVQANNQ